MLSCTLFAGLYAVALLVEIAYRFDRYGSTGMIVAAAIFVWVAAAFASGLALDWKLTRVGKTYALSASLLFVLAATGLMFAASCWFLPAVPITGSDVQAYTAQGAYLKTIVLYFLLHKLAFWLLPFHFVLAMQTELQAGRPKLVWGVLTGDRLSIAPHGVFYPRMGALILLLLAMVIVTIFLHNNLMNHLTPGPYQNLFTQLVNVRLFLYYALAVKCLIWYHGALNELKRECLLVEQ